MPQTDSSVASRRPKQAHRVPPYRRPLVVGGFLIILASVVAVTILVCKNLNDKTNDPVDNKPVAGEVTPPEPVESQPDDDLEHKTPQYEGEDANDWGVLTGNIIYQDVDPETRVLHSAVSIDQYLQGDGQCVFNLQRDGATVRTTSAVASADVTTSACGPFALSVEGLSGIYQIEVIMTGDNKRGTITGEIIIE